MIDKNIMARVIADTRKLTDTEVQQVRENGLGNGFSVTDPADGFRQDDTLWFGTCSVCGETVHNSWRDGIWKHTVYTSRTFYDNGLPKSSSSYDTDYCPTARGEVASE